MSLTSKPHYVVILSDSTSLCMCMYIINQGMPCQHQYRVLLQSSKAIFHMGFIHTHWFESGPVETTNHITIFQGTKTYTTKLLRYIDQMRIANSYTPTIKENINKKIKFSAMMSVAKTSVQVAMEEGATSELTGLLIEFIMKYHRNTGLNIEEVRYLSDKTQESPNISNPEYHKPKGRPPKRFKSSTEENNVQHIFSSSKTCSYYFEKGHNIRGCNQYKSDLADKKNN
ncbi:3322_t:CDS:1 [Cetraspora pellucida]|uniref:3322_t:CDS:1 n=1 Tax=Cetraspora pellucida TaxID=1433469 RepID=A0ACA9MZY9_9GLOM|nr:3322_t:CDS:1 [Cetraspora pellucida]